MMSKTFLSTSTPPPASELEAENARLREALLAANARAEDQWAGWVKEGVARKAAEARLAEAMKALEPFARLIDEMKFDIDNNGNPLPDDQSVGWVYVTIGDFRAARRVREGGKVDG